MVMPGVKTAELQGLFSVVQDVVQVGSPPQSLQASSERPCQHVSLASLSLSLSLCIYVDDSLSLALSLCFYMYVCLSFYFSHPLSHTFMYTHTHTQYFCNSTEEVVHTSLYVTHMAQTLHSCISLVRVSKLVFN